MRSKYNNGRNVLGVFEPTSNKDLVNINTRKFIKSDIDAKQKDLLDEFIDNVKEWIKKILN